MISVNDFRTGLTIEVDGEIFSVLEFQHVKPGKGAAFVRSKLKNLRNGNIVEKTFRAGENVNRAQIENREVQYLYNSGNEYTFMDNETFDQFTLDKKQLEWEINFLKENMNVPHRQLSGRNHRHQPAEQRRAQSRRDGARHPRQHGDGRDEEREAGNRIERSGAAVHQRRRRAPDRHPRRQIHFPRLMCGSRPSGTPDGFLMQPARQSVKFSIPDICLDAIILTCM